MKKILMAVVAAAGALVLSAEMPRSEWHAKVGDCALDPAALKSTISQLSSADKTAFLAEVNAAIDKRGAIGALGGMQSYQQMKAADALGDMAKNQGTGGTMMGMMMGGNLGAFAGQQFQQSQQPQYQQPQQQMAPPPPPPAAPMFYVAVNGQQQGPFTIQALQGMIASGGFGPNSLVWTAGMSGWQAASTVAALSALFGAVPPPPPPIK